MRVPELKALARECRLRGYSRMRRAELIELIPNDQWNTNTPLQSWEPSMGLEGSGSHAPDGTQSASLANSTSTTSTRPEPCKCNSNLGTYR